MKRVFIATVVTLALCATTLVGCGSSTESASYEVPASAENIPAGNDDIEEPALEVADAYQEEAEDEVDFGRPPEDECVPWGESTEEEVVPDTGEIEGIIVLQGDYKSNAYALSFIVSAINPQTGDYHIVSSFVFEHVARIQEDEFLIDPAYKFTCCSNYRGLFNDDYTLMAATKTFLSDESKHAGWFAYAQQSPARLLSRLCLLDHKPVGARCLAPMVQVSPLCLRRSKGRKTRQFISLILMAAPLPSD